MEGETARDSGSLRWDSAWQGGSGRRKRRKRKRKGAGDAKKDMAAACGSHKKREERVETEDDGMRLRKREVGGGDAAKSWRWYD